MATHIGNEGSVYLGANAVGEVRSWSLDIQQRTVDDSAMADTWDTHVVGGKAWTAEVTCAFDEADTNGQTALTIGASVTLNLYYEGNSSGDKYWTGTATVVGIRAGSGRDQLLEGTYSFQGNGTLSHSTV